MNEAYLSVKYNTFTSYNSINLLKIILPIVIFSFCLLLNVKSESIINLNSCSDRISLFFNLIYNISLSFIIKDLLKFLLIMVSYNSSSWETIMSAITFFLYVITVILFYLFYDDYLSLRDDCLIYYCFQVKYITLIINIISISILGELCYLIFVILFFKYLVWYFISYTALVFKYIGVSPFLFNCFEKHKFKNISHKLDDATCVICCCELSENDEVIQLKCHPSHIYHSNCIIEWLKGKFFCPICKKYEIV